MNTTPLGRYHWNRPDVRVLRVTFGPGAVYFWIHSAVVIWERSLMLTNYCEAGRCAAPLRARSLVFFTLSCAIVATSSSALAAPRVYNINSAQSQIDLTASADFLGGSGALVEQFPSSITRYTGNIVIQNFPSGDVNMQGGGAATALNLRQGNSTPSVDPGVGGSGTKAPANYGVTMTADVEYEIGVIEIPGVGNFNFGTVDRVEVDLALRGLAWDFSAPNPMDRNPITGEFDASELSLIVASGVADTRASIVLRYGNLLDKTVAQAAFAILLSQYPELGLSVTSPSFLSNEVHIGMGTGIDLTGTVLPNSAAGMGTVTNVGPPYPVPSTLTLPVGATLPNIGIPGLLEIDLSFTGTLVATGIIPEPSTIVLAGIGLASVLCYGARRRRR